MPKPSQIKQTQQSRGDAKQAQRWADVMMRTKQRHEQERAEREAKRKDAQATLSGRAAAMSQKKMRRIGRRMQDKPDMPRPPKEAPKDRQAWARSQQVYLRRMAKPIEPEPQKP